MKAAGTQLASQAWVVWAGHPNHSASMGVGVRSAQAHPGMGSELPGSKGRWEIAAWETVVQRAVMQRWGHFRSSVRLGKAARLGCSWQGEREEGVQLCQLAQAAGALGMTPAQPRWGLGSQGFLQNMPGHSRLRYSRVPAAAWTAIWQPTTHRLQSRSAELSAAQATATAGRLGTHAARVAVKAVHSTAKVTHSLEGGQRVGVWTFPSLLQEVTAMMAAVEAALVARRKGVETAELGVEGTVAAAASRPALPETGR